MPRTTAGYRYPHATTAARQHDHRWCRVTGAAAGRAAAGAEEWGTPHILPPVTDAALAAEIRRGLFRGRNCTQLRSEYGDLSVSVTYQAGDGTLSNTPVTRGGAWVLVLRVWPRAVAKREISRRVRAGEPLSYNVLRK